MPERYRGELRKKIEDHFNEEELRTLCFDLDVDYESLPAEGKAGKARELVAIMDRVGSMDDLVGELRRLRPKVSWADVMPDTSSEEQSPTGSPYIVGPPIRNPRDLFGRRDLVDRFYRDALLGAGAVSACLIGARRSGKTSFLRYISHPEVLRSKLGNRADKRVVVYMNLQRIAPSQADFFAGLLQAAERAFDDQHGTHPGITHSTTEVTFEMVREYFGKVCRPGWRVVLMLDEFEKLKRDDTFDEAFFDRLRSLATDMDLGWITASLTNPFSQIEGQVSERAPSDKTSPFGNLFAGSLYVGALSDDDTRRLVTQPAARLGLSFDDEDVQYAVEMAGRLPYALQAAAWGLYDAYHQGRTGKESQEAARGRFDETVARHFNGWWQHFTPGQRVRITDLAAGTQPTSQDDRNLKRLADYGFVEQTGGKFRILGSAFTEWIRDGARTIPE